MGPHAYLFVAAANAGGPAYAYDLVVNQNWNRFFKAFDRFLDAHPAP